MTGWVSSCVFKPFSLSGFLSSSLSVLLVDVEVEPTPELLRHAARLHERAHRVQELVAGNNGASRAELVGGSAEHFGVRHSGVFCTNPAAISLSCTRSGISPNFPIIPTT